MAKIRESNTAGTLKRMAKRQEDTRGRIAHAMKQITPPVMERSKAYIESQSTGSAYGDKQRSDFNRRNYQRKSK